MSIAIGETRFATVTYFADQIDNAIADQLSALDRVAKQIEPMMMANPEALHARLEGFPILQSLFNAVSLYRVENDSSRRPISSGVSACGNDANFQWTGFWITAAS